MKTARTPNAEGLTLIEVMMTMGIFAIIASAMIATTLQTRKQAEFLVYQNAANTAAQGYLEQLKTMEYMNLEASYANNSVALPTKALSYAGTADEGDLEIDDPIYIGSETEKTVLIDIDVSDSDNPREITMPFFVTVTANDLSGSSLEAMEISIDYRYTSPHMGSPKEMSGSVRSVITGIE